MFIRKYQEISGNTNKLQEIPKIFRKYLEISGNTCKFQEILGNTRKYQEILGNTKNTLTYLEYFHFLEVLTFFSRVLPLGMLPHFFHQTRQIMGRAKNAVRLFTYCWVHQS
jgi:hypothetical protein